MTARVRFPIALALSLAALATVSAATDDLCLVPEGAIPAAGGTLRVGMSSPPSAPLAWPGGAAGDFFLLDGQGRLDLKTATPDGTHDARTVPLRAPGTTIVAIATAPRYVTVQAREFEAALKRDGHEDILDMRVRMDQSRAPARVRERRYGKTLVDAAGESSDVALANLKMTLEILPETRPSGLRPGGRLPVRVLFEGAPDAGALLCSGPAEKGRPAQGYAWCGRLDDAGRASVPIDTAGLHFVRTTRVRALAGDERADWASYAATLTFEIRAEAPAAGTDPPDVFIDSVVARTTHP